MTLSLEQLTALWLLLTVVLMWVGGWVVEWVVEWVENKLTGERK